MGEQKVNGKDQHAESYDADIHLKLDGLEKMMEQTNKTLEAVGDGIISELKELRNILIPAVAGKDQIPLAVAMTIFKALCIVLVALVAWTTGLKALTGF